MGFKEFNAIQDAILACEKALSALCGDFELGPECEKAQEFLQKAHEVMHWAIKDNAQIASNESDDLRLSREYKERYDSVFYVYFSSNPDIHERRFVAAFKTMAAAYCFIAGQIHPKWFSVREGFLR